MDNERGSDPKKRTGEERRSLGKKELDRKRGRNKRRETVKWRQNKWERRKRGQCWCDVSVIISSHSQHGIYNGKINLPDSCVIGFAGSRAESEPSG